MTEAFKVSQALKPCPFCGGIWVVINRPANGSQPAVKCKACNATGPYTAGQSDQQISEAWNTRHESQLLLLEAAERVLEHFNEKGLHKSRVDLPLGHQFEAVSDLRKALATIRGEGA